MRLVPLLGVTVWMAAFLALVGGPASASVMVDGGQDAEFSLKASLPPSAMVVENGEHVNPESMLYRLASAAETRGALLEEMTTQVAAAPAVAATPSADAAAAPADTPAAAGGADESPPASQRRRVSVVPEPATLLLLAGGAALALVRRRGR